MSQWACCFIPQIIPQIKGRTDIYTQTLVCVQNEGPSPETKQEIIDRGQDRKQLSHLQNQRSTTAIARCNAGLKHFRIVHASYIYRDKQCPTLDRYSQTGGQRFEDLCVILQLCNYVTIYGRKSAANNLQQSQAQGVAAICTSTLF